MNKVVYGNQTVLDLTSTTAEESDVLQGYKFHKANGEQTTGTAGCRDDYPTIIIPGISYKMVSWASGTDQQIADMVRLHYENKINLYDYWGVNNQRTVSLSAVSGQPAQNVVMVLMHKGYKKLVTSIGGKTTCAFVVGLLNPLSTNMNLDSETQTYSWNNCDRRTWCNNTFRSSIPETLRSIFKQTINYHGGSQKTLLHCNDYFAVPCEKEIYGTNEDAQVDETNTVQFTWYANSNNIIKNKAYWTRTYYNSSYYVYVASTGNRMTSAVSASYGIAPFGVI